MQEELQSQGKDFLQLDSARYEEQVQSILLEFERLFTDLAYIKPVASYLCFTFGPRIDEDFIATPGINGEFWNLCAFNLTALFGSTYLSLFNFF